MPIPDDTQLFSGGVNWKDVYTITYEFKTSIISRQDGTEQRIALRRSPRKTLAFTSNGLRTRAQAVRGQLYRSIAGRFILPEEPASVRLAVGAAAGAEMVVLTAPLPGWARQGSFVVLGRGDKAEAKQLVVGEGLNLVFDEPLAFDHGVDEIVSPGRIGRINTGQSTTRTTSGVIETALAFTEEPVSEAYPTLDDPLLAVSRFWHGIELFLQRPDWSQQQAVTANADLTTIDLDVGLVSTVVDDDLPWPVYQPAFTALGRARAMEIVGLFYRARGQQGTFYAPTWDLDFDVPVFAAGATSLIVPGRALYESFADDEMFRNVAALVHGTAIPLNVARIDAVGLDSRIVLTEPLPFEVTPAAVPRWCWLLQFRMASDQLSIAWQTDSVARATMSWRVVPDDFGAFEINGQRVIVGGQFVTMSPAPDALPLGTVLKMGGKYIQINSGYVSMGSN